MFDTLTLLHPNHISPSGSKNSKTWSEIVGNDADTIEARYSDWLSDAGYLVLDSSTAKLDSKLPVGPALRGGFEK